MKIYTAKQNETEFTANQDEIETLYVLRRGGYQVYAYEIDSVLFHSEDVTVSTAYQIEGETFEDECEAQEKLESMFVEFIRECVENSGKNEFANDIPAIREAFSCWSDDLQRDGRICDDAGNKLCLGDEMENRIASGLKNYRRFSV